MGGSCFPSRVNGADLGDLWGLVLRSWCVGEIKPVKLKLGKYSLSINASQQSTQPDLTYFSCLLMLFFFYSFILNVNFNLFRSRRKILFPLLLSALALANHPLCCILLSSCHCSARR